MGKQKTHEEYVKELSTKKPQIICLERYIKNNIKLKHKCLQCEYEWNVYPTTMTCTKSGCPKCLGLNKKTHEEYILELKNINPNFRCLDHYINNNTKIKHKCLQCTFIWNVKPRNLLSKHGCPNCKPNHKKTTAEYIEHLKSKNKNILCLEQYINSATKIKHQCKICKYKWYAYPNALLSTRKIGCPVCNISKGEQRITNILKTNNIIFEQQRTYEDLYFKSVKHPLRFDFYLPLYNLLIEYNGKQHYEHIEHFTTKELFQEQQIRDNLKIEYCIKNNIELKIIRYDEDIQLEVKKIINILKQE